MQRYYVSEDKWHESVVVLTGNDVHHIKRVMRLQLEDKIICNHPNGKAAICIIDEITDEHINVTIDEWLDNNTELPVSVTIAQGLPKGKKLELILQKGTELGASAFQIFEADRSIAKWDHKKAANRYKRYNEIMKEASEQCHRNVKPELKEVQPLKQIIAVENNYDHILFGYEEAAKGTSSDSFGEVLSKVRQGESILIIIGPEGGFSKEEVVLLQNNAAVPVRLGKRILRTETASLYALASISYHFEEIINSD